MAVVANRPGALAGFRDFWTGRWLRYLLSVTKRCPSCEASWNGVYAKKYMSYCHHCGSKLIEPEVGEEDAETADTTEYDGPELNEMIKFSVLVGPEGGIGAWPADDGAIYVTPYTAYQYRNGEWVDLDADTEELFRSIATYVNPQEIRERQRTR